MSRHCIAAGCDSVGRIGYSLYKFPHDGGSEISRLRPLCSREAIGMAHHLTHYCAQNIFADDCFVTEGVCILDEIGMPTAKRLKPDAAPAIFARSIDHVEPSSTS